MSNAVQSVQPHIIASHTFDQMKVRCGARLRGALGEARLLHRLLRALRDRVAGVAEVGERLRRLHHLLHLRLGARDLVLHVLGRAQKGRERGGGAGGGSFSPA